VEQVNVPGKDGQVNSFYGSLRALIVNSAERGRGGVPKGPGGERAQDRAVPTETRSRDLRLPRTPVWG